MAGKISEYGTVAAAFEDGDLLDVSKSLGGGSYDSQQLPQSVVLEFVQDAVGGMFSGNTETLVTITYQDIDGTIDVVVDNDLGNYDATNLTITESQISDLQAYLTDITGEALSSLSDVTISAIASGELLKWNGSAWINNTLAEAGIAAASHVHAAADITSGTFADALIAETNVTQHQAALSITESQISDLGSYQTEDGTLTSLAALGTAADRYAYTTGVDTWAEGTITAFARTILDDVDAATVRATVGVDAAGTDNSTDVTLAGSYDYLTIAGQVITLAQIDLATDVTGNLPVANLNSGTGASASTFWRGDGSWATPAGSGDVSGPGASTDNAIARWDSTTGTLLLNSGVIISDTNVITGGTWDGTFGSTADEAIQDLVGAMLSGNTETLITVTYQDVDGTIDFVVDNDLSNYSNATSGFITGITAEPLSDLSDVTITTIASGEILKWDGAAWINNTLAEAGIAAASHTHTESDITDLGAYITASSTDTLTNKTFDANGTGNSISNVDLSADVTGNLPVANLNSGTGASASTFWRGDGTWATPAGSGDVSGPGSSTDHAIARWDLTSGTLLLNSGVIIDDTNNVSGIANLTLTGTTTLNTVAYTWPGADGSSGQVLSTNGAGTLSWTTAGGSGNVTKVGTPVDNQIGVWTGDGTIEGDANFTWDGTDLTVTGGIAAGADSLYDVGAALVRFANGYFDNVYGILQTASQPNITAVGTISSGTWTGTVVDIAYGGTGRALTDPNADRLLGWDDSAGAGGQMEWITIGSGLTLTGTTLSATGGGGSQNLFETIAGDSGTNPVADSTTDTLTIAGGTNIATVGDSATDTITINFDGNLPVSNLNSGTGASASTFWRGDGTWATPAGGGDVTKVGTPVNNQVGVWTGDGTLEGTSALTFDGTTLSTVDPGSGTPSADWLSGVSAGAATYSDQGNYGILAAVASATNRPIFFGRRARGTTDTPTTVADTDLLFTIFGSGYQGTGFENAAAIHFAVDGTPTASTVPTALYFETGEDFSTRLERFRIDPDGVITLSNSAYFSTLELGHASDTTLTRVSAGVAAIEGNNILTANLIGSTVQAQGAVLDDLNTLGANSADGEFLVGTGAGALAWESGATARTSLGVAIGTDVQAYDAGLASIAGLTTAADKMIYTTALDTYAVTDLSSFGRTLIDDADASAARTTLGVAIGSDVQAYDADLYRRSFAITINNPDTSVDASIFFTSKAITVQEMRAVVRGTTPSVTWTIRHSATDRSATGNEVVTSGTTTTSTTSGSDVTSFDDATIPADSFVWIEVTAASGTVDEFHVTGEFLYD